MPVLDAAGAQQAAQTGLLLDAGPRSATAVRPSGPIRWRATSPARSARPDRQRAPRAAPSPAPPNSPPGSPPWGQAGAGGKKRSPPSVGSGITAHRGAVPSRWAGIPAALYVGSWSNWMGESARPVATGA